MSKSLLTNLVSTSNSKSIFYPVASNSELNFSASVIANINDCMTNYTTYLENKDYPSISTDLPTYFGLLSDLKIYEATIQNPTLGTMVQIVTQSLTGSLNASELYQEKLSSSIQILQLNQQVNDILAGKNDMIALGGGTSNMNITQTIYLAPIFNFYLILYGVPAMGVGFDPNKLNLLMAVLAQLNIDPYGVTR